MTSSQTTTQEPPQKPLSASVKLLCSACIATGLAGFLWLHYNTFGLALSLTTACLMWFSLGANTYTLEQRHKIAEAIAGVGIVVFLGLLLSADLLTALMALLMVAQLAMNIRADHNNRVYSAIIIGFVCLLAGAADAKTGHYLWFMAGFGLAAAFTLKAIYLTLTPTQQQGLSQNNSAAGRLPPFKHNAQLAGTTLALALLIYLFMPRFPAGNIGAHAGGSDHFYENSSWEQEADSQPDNSDNAQAQTPQNTRDNTSDNAQPQKPRQPMADDSYQYDGFDESFSVQNPDSKSSRFSNAIIARVKSDLPLYLKARVFDQFDGERWSQSQQQLNKKRLKRGHYEAEYSSLTAASNGQNITVDYQVHIERPMRSNIPFAERLTELDFPATVIARDAFGQWFAPGPLQAGTVYGAQAQLLTRDGRLFSTLTAKTQGVTAANAEAQKLLDENQQYDQQQRLAALANYLTLPANLDPRIYTLARDNAGHQTGSQPQQQQAIALETFLRTQYDYDFESIFSSQNVTPLANFLFETRKGHCEYFASALTIMLRTLGIPARVVTGLLAHNQNPLTGYYEVRALDGHAWVEAYVDDRGWMLLEPTAYYPMPTAPEHNSGVTAEKIQQYIRELERAEQETGGNQAFSFPGLMRSTWYSLTLVVTVALATVKLAIVKLWWLWLALALLAIFAYRLWQKHGGALQNRYLLYRLDKGHNLTIEQHLHWLHKALNNLAEYPEPGLTIERFMAFVACSHLSSEQRQQAAELFNRYYYTDRPLSPEHSQQLLQLLAQLLRQTLAKPL